MDTLNDAGLNSGTGEPRCLLLGMDGDLAFSGGSLVMARGSTATAQRVRVAVLLWLGEWFLDIGAGTDWLQVFSKPPQVERARGLLRQRIASVSGVASVEDVSLDFNAAERRLSLGYSATTEDGDTVAGTVTQ